MQILRFSYGRHASLGGKHLGHASSPSDLKDTLSLVPVGVWMTECRQPRTGYDWAHFENLSKESGARARRSQSLLVKLNLLDRNVLQNELAKPSGKAGFSWSGTTGTTSTSRTAFARLSVKLGLLGAQSTVSRQKPSLQSLLAKLRLRGALAPRLQSTVNR